jgi:hypothetical protein
MACGGSALLSLHCAGTAVLHLMFGHAAVGFIVAITAYATRLRAAQ